MIASAFGETAPFSLGVEEEAMILDAETLDQAGEVRSLLAEAAGRELPGELKTELHASIVELATEVCDGVPAVERSLRELRGAAAEAAAACGLAIACAGTHPFARAEEQPVVDEERYTSFVGYAGIAARRQGVQGLHVHVSVGSGEDCWRALEWVLPWLPLVLALSANSPWLGGRLTGFASNRAPVLAELPRAGAPPALGSYAGWERWVERLVELGLADDYTRVWWDVRPHPRFGTLELRIPDQPTALSRTVLHAALAQALVAAALDRPPAEPCDRGYYAQNRWAAARFGVGAELIHPDGDRLVGVPELWEELLRALAPAAARLGTLGLLSQLDPSTSEASRQLDGSPREVAARLVERTVVS